MMEIGFEENLEYKGPVFAYWPLGKAPLQS